MKCKMNYKKGLIKSIKPETIAEEYILADLILIYNKIGHIKLQEHLDKIKLIEDER